MKRKKDDDAKKVPVTSGANGPGDEVSPARASAGPARLGSVPPEVVAAALATAPRGDGPTVRFGVSLLVALAATLPAFLNVVAGRATLGGASGRFLAAFAVAWAGATIVSHLFARWAMSPGAPTELTDAGGPLLSTAGTPADLVPGDASGAR
jgi:hypothetical protein